jgi:hypothetical protein
VAFHRRFVRSRSIWLKVLHPLLRAGTLQCFCPRLLRTIPACVRHARSHRPARGDRIIRQSLLFPVLLRSLEQIELPLLSKFLLDSFCGGLQMILDRFLHSQNPPWAIPPAVNPPLWRTGSKDAHFVSRYIISGVARPRSQALTGRNVLGPLS